MVLGVISDTHLGSTGSLERILAGPLGRADVLLHAGDHTGRNVVDHLEYVESRPYYGVAGNCDGGLGLPVKRDFILDGVRIGMLHGVGVRQGEEHKLLGRFEGELDLLIFGHTHKPLIERHGATLILNPGSPFQPRHGGHGTVALVTLDGGDIKTELVRP